MPAFQFDNAKSGRITLIGGPYTAYTGWAECETGRLTPFNRWRAFFSFDTSSIPDTAVIISCTMSLRRRADPVGDPETYLLWFSIGTFIGAALDGNAGEWNGGTAVTSLSVKPADKETVDLTSAAYPYVNKTGDTDLKLWDDSSEGGGDPSWATRFNKNAGNLCKLNVEWTIPNLGVATATGRGTASAAGTVSGGIEATATATGIGTASASAVLEVPGSATVKGVGTASASAVLEIPGAATATGVGTASAAGTVEGILFGVATATGVGKATAAAVLTIPGAGTATGVGAASAKGVQVFEGAATATGIGEATAAAVLVIPGAATATGIGTAAGAGTVEGVLFGVAIATGIGAASGAAVLIIPGVATATGVGAASGDATLWLTGIVSATGIGSAAAAATLWLSAVATATGIGTASGVGVVGGNIARWGERCETYAGGPSRGCRD